MTKIAILLFMMPGLFTGASCQEKKVNDTLKADTLAIPKFTYKALIIPSLLVSYGIVGMESDQLKSWNIDIQQEVTEDIDEKITIDDFSQWAPAASAFALEGLGIKAKHSFKDRSTIFLTSFVIMNATVFGLKSLTKIERPDGSSQNSFPSGHTANAFAGAEFLWQEYKDKSPWYGIAGYAIATGTGIFRIYNNRHWLTDVAAGAGIGILSTKIAYWINPYVNSKIFGKEKSASSSSMIVPLYDGTHIGLNFIKSF